MRRRLQFTLGAIFFAFLLIYGGERFFRSFALLGMESGPGWTIRQTGNQVRINQVRTAEPFGMIREGDEVLSLNGQPVRSPADVAELFHSIEPGAVYTLLVRREGAILEFALRSQEIPWLSWIVNGAAS